MLVDRVTLQPKEYKSGHLPYLDLFIQRIKRLTAHRKTAFQVQHQRFNQLFLHHAFHQSVGLWHSRSLLHHPLLLCLADPISQYHGDGAQ